MAAQKITIASLKITKYNNLKNNKMKNYTIKNILANLKAGVKYSLFDIYKLVPLGTNINQNDIKNLVNTRQLFNEYNNARNCMEYYKPITL